MRYLEIVLICELGAPLVHTRPAQLFLRHAILPYCHAVHWRTPYRCVLARLTPVKSNISQSDSAYSQCSKTACGCRRIVTDSMMKLGQANLTHLWRINTETPPRHGHMLQFTQTTVNKEHRQSAQLIGAQAYTVQLAPAAATLGGASVTWRNCTSAQQLLCTAGNVLIDSNARGLLS